MARSMLGWMSLQVVAVVLVISSATLPAVESVWVFRGDDGRLVYRPDAEGDRIADFAWCGYRDGREDPPGAATLAGLPGVAVSADGDDDDDAPRIQAAIEEVSAFARDAAGWRGVVRLAAGTYELDGELRIGASGVVLQGAGDGADPASATILVHRETAQVDTISVAGVSNRQLRNESRHDLLDPVVPAGARSFRVDGLDGLAVGDEVLIRWSGNDAWHQAIEMDAAHLDDEAWSEGMIDLDFDRIVTRLETIGSQHWVTVDAPLPNAVVAAYSTFTPHIIAYDHPGRIEQVGVVDLRGRSTFSAPDDEAHPWHMLRASHARDVWFERVTAQHYGRSTVRTGIRRLTVRECRFLDPVSVITGNRRYAFSITGQQVLVVDCLARDSRHDYVLEQWTPGPIAFVDCRSEGTWSDIGPHRQWGAGVLFDRTHARGRFTIEGGELVARGDPLAGDKPGTPHLVRETNAPAVDPLVYRVDVRVRCVDAQARPAVVVRRHDLYDRAYYYLELDASRLALKKFRFSNDPEVLDSWPLPGDFDRSAWHDLAVIHDGSRLAGLLDGVERVSLNNGEFDQEARFGLRIADGEARFDDLTVTDLAGSTAYVDDDFADPATLRAYYHPNAGGLAAINVRNRGKLGTGHGWSGANNVIWNADAETYIVQNPPTAQNWLIGSVGLVIDDEDLAGPQAPAYRDSLGQPVTPGSLHAAQVDDRFAITDADFREYWLGDVDDGVADATSVFADPGWIAEAEAELGAPARRFDEAAGPEPAVASFRFALAADEHAAAASLGLGVSAVGPNARLYLESTTDGLALTDFTLAAGSDGLALDLSPWLGRLADGDLHLAVTDAEVDWAVLDLVVAPGQPRSRVIEFRLQDQGGGIDAGIELESPPESQRTGGDGRARFDGLMPAVDHLFFFDGSPSGSG